MVRQRMTGKQRREQLIAIGRSLFAERGFEGTSVEEIAMRAGVSKPVVYEHFGGKEGLYAVVIDREMTRLEHTITEALRTGRSRARVEQAVIALLTYVEDENPTVFKYWSATPNPAWVAATPPCLTTP